MSSPYSTSRYEVSPGSDRQHSLRGQALLASAWLAAWAEMPPGMAAIPADWDRQHPCWHLGGWAALAEMPPEMVAIPEIPECVTRVNI